MIDEFSFSGAGHRPGRWLRTVKVHADDGSGLELREVLIFSQGVALAWSYAPAQPWTAGQGPPFGAPPATWSFPGSPNVPPPPAFAVADDEGTEYRDWGWQFGGSPGGWTGESRLVPPGPLGDARIPPVRQPLALSIGFAALKAEVRL